MKNKEYIKKWKIFYDLLENKGFTINSFSKKYEYFGDKWLLEEYSQNKFLNKLKKMKAKYLKLKEEINLKGTDDKSLEHLNDLILYLENDYIVQEIHDDESYGSWFD